mmetsp:Transcript_2409/g.3493  ORF Transcript_2409/g.3493 Transcript_2409/m.3493 type:complete len:605 (+) Transcript_2409:217-2031(+)|eukprot:CAMPEP_0171458144 /NCGR_PEP_ID=MMETSP0945-20130129/3941_1 /TAXON_ID=109269 /ORGANISM="Vaucheria litorea, Strain CCMP2940" /LENGTH=604 /DNA_ID=CAMNT_0011983895 /DNA_START=208 /DNA_END=2022 /DNA_ORIENTATION=+
MKRGSVSPEISLSGNSDAKESLPHNKRRTIAWLIENEGLKIPPRRSDFFYVGQLLKRRGGLVKMVNSSWKPRCFIITKRGYLLYYEESNFERIDFTSDPPRGMVNLSECVISVSKNEVESSNDFVYTIEVRVGKKDQSRWKIAGESGDDMENFLECTNQFSNKKPSNRNSLNDSCNEMVVPNKSSCSSSPSSVDGEASIERPKSFRKTESVQLRQEVSGHNNFYMLLVINICCICMGYMEKKENPSSSHRHMNLLMLAIINIVIGICIPKRAPFPSGCYTAVPLVHDSDLAPLLKAIRTNQIAKRKKEIMKSSDASMAQSLAPFAGATMSRAIDHAPGNLSAPPHTWQEGNHEVFNVRGPKYMKDGKKVPSSPGAYRMIGCDIYSCNERIDNIADAHINMKNFGEKALKSPLEAVPSLLVVNCQLPSDKNSSNGDDGPTNHLILYFSLTEEAVEALKDRSKASKALELWIQYCTRQASEDQFRGRFKVIAVIENWAESQLPGQLKSWNGKPVLISKTGKIFAGKLASTNEGTTCLEMDINVHKFRSTAKKVLFGLTERFKNMVLHVGFTIEGRNAEELPEAILGCTCLNYPDPKAAPKLSIDID